MLFKFSKLIFLILGVGLVAFAASAYLSGYRFNQTLSYPGGIWQIEALSKNDIFSRGQLVVFCPPKNSSTLTAKSFGYLGSGFCANGHKPMIKEIVGVAGDKVSVQNGTVSINNRIYGGIIANDGKLRRIPMERPPVKLKTNQVFVMARHDKSFDSRYFGPIERKSIQGRIKPVFLWIDFANDEKFKESFEQLWRYQ